MGDRTLPSPYRLAQGSRRDRVTLVAFMSRCFHHQAEPPYPAHLVATVDAYLSDQTPLWWVEHPTAPQPIAGLWLGTATDQRQGHRHSYVLLLYVDPPHRRRGLATVLLQTAHHWAEEQGHPHVALQVFADNQPARALYASLGYATDALLLKRTL